MTAQGAARRGADPGDGGVLGIGEDGSVFILLPPVFQVPHERLPLVRSLWWRLRRRYGVTLPPQAGVILVEGGRHA